MKAPTLWQRLTAFVRPRAPARQAEPVPVRPPAAEPTPPQPDHPAPSHKQVRAEHRVQLEAVLRETLLRAGILPNRYKSRALSLDRQADHFIVLCELDGRDTDTRHSALNALETALQRQLKASQPHLQVQQVYWRVRHPVEAVPEAPEPPVDFAPTQPMTGPTDDPSH